MRSPNGNDSKSIHDRLIQTYLDGETSAAQDNQVRCLLNEPWFCERLAQFSLDSACLHELGQQGMLEQPQAAGTESLLPTSPLGRAGYVSRNRLVQAAAVLAVSLSMLAVMIQFWPNRNAIEVPVTENPALGHLQEVASAVILRNGGDRMPATEDATLRSGDTLQTEGPEGFATFLFDDGTSLVIVGDASVLLGDADGQKRVDVDHGDVDADVAPQPDGKPMLFVTLQAEARVMGTRLSISAETNATTLSVSEGHVAMKRLSDGRSVDVRGGYQAVASPSSELTAQATPPAPDSWTSDFEDGLPDNWRIGQWVTDDLPGNSRGAVRTERWNPTSGLYYAIRSNRVITGLFHVRDDTYLNFTYKLDRPGWFNLFAVVRHRDGSRQQTGNFAYQEASWWQIPASQWHTVSIPMTRFHKVLPGRATDGSMTFAQPGDAVNSIWFSTPKKDRGLTIDRVWVTRGKPTEDRSQ